MTAFVRRLAALLTLVALNPLGAASAADVAALAAPTIVEPASGALLDVPSTQVVVSTTTGESVTLSVNGVRVKDDQLAKVVRAGDGSTIRTWAAVALQAGRNVISARVDRGSAPSAPVETIVNVRGGAKKLVLAASRSSVPADGRSIVSINGQLLDEQNHLAARDALVRLTSTAGTFVGDSAQPESPGFYVQAHDGRFVAVLRAGLHSGTAHLTASAGDLGADLDIEMLTELRPSIATGVVDLRFGAREGNFYRDITSFMDGAPGSTPELQTSVFATGKVGDYLLTVAGDNQYPINPACDGRIGVTTYAEQSSCTPQYPIYGDESTYERLAQSSDNVYFRLERERTYAMWGDYDSKEFASPTQLYSATMRNLHGAKVNYEPGKLEAASFFANNIEAYQRDSIAPDGTSGDYYLSHSSVVPGSEDVYVESYLFDQPGVIETVTPYVRSIGYDIDYARGAILFHAPVVRTDLDPEGRVVVNVIVVTYEYDGGQGTGDMVGGRLRYQSFVPHNDTQTPFSVGASAVHENMGDSSFSLTGIDLGAPLGKVAKAVGEYAQSTNDTAASGTIGGQAYRLEAALQSGRTTGNAYYRTTNAGFSNDATTSFVPGQSQQGLNVDTPVARRTDAFFTYGRQRENGIAPEVLDDPLDLLVPGGAPVPGAPVNTDDMTLGGGVRQRIGTGKLSAEYDSRQNTDFNSPLLDTDSAQFVARYLQPFGKRWTYLAEDDINVRDQIDEAYPSRIATGVAYNLMPGVTLAATHQYMKDIQSGPQTFNTLEALGEDKLDANTSFTGRYALLGGLDGYSATSAFGLKHLFRVAKGVSATAAYEYLDGSVFDLTPSGLQFAQPYAVGQAGAPALGVSGGTSLSLSGDYVGSQYLKGTARYEHRVSDQGSNTTYSFGGAGKLSDAVSLLTGYDRAGGANQVLGGLAANADFRAGAAYRNPYTDTTNVLFRYESQINPGLTPTTLLQGAGTWTRDDTLALEVLHDPSKRLELYGKIAFRSSTAFLAGDFTNSTYTSLAQARATYRVGRRWDATAELRWISQAVSSYGALGEVAEAGYAFGDDFRGAIGYSFGRANDTEFYGSNGHGGVYFDVTARVHELWHGFGLQRALLPDLTATGLPAAAAVPEGRK